MKTPFRILMVLVLSCGILLPTTMASAKETRIEFTGYEVCTGELDILKEWYPGWNYQARGATETCIIPAEGNIAMLAGIDNISDMAGIFVGNWNNHFNVVLHGKLRLETYEGGVWVGSWEMTSSDFMIKIIAHGEGLYEGMQLHLYEDWLAEWNGEPSSPFYGYISYYGD
jgi:hypothetical protein